MNIEHTDWDTGEKVNVEKRELHEMPERVDSVKVTHDGGRLGIYINDILAFYESEGTRDCEVVIRR